MMEKKSNRKRKLRWTSYLPIVKQPAKLRLYLNDPEIAEHLKKKSIPVPIEVKGEFLMALGEDKKLHIIFIHENYGFMPVFFDLENAKLDFNFGVREKRR